MTRALLIAKTGGFRKEALTWRRRHGETTQVIHVQRSHGNTASEARFYVRPLRMLHLSSLSSVAL
ncbi:DUF4304 domain-containing protein [Myxococcus xanthus]|uniref:DUF4304 domain-containing protein n=1 Tax=Myxococcus xanthus TaxID=34 RepID=UPI0019175DB7|nr:DUF4304 domain-containing protein [Myxococcus xanthus]